MSFLTMSIIGSLISFALGCWIGFTCPWRNKNITINMHVDGDVTKQRVEEIVSEVIKKIRKDTGYRVR